VIIMRISPEYMPQNMARVYAERADQTNPAGATAAAGAGRAAPGGDRVELSPEGKSVQSLLDALKRIPEVREARVSEIKAQIQAGTYRVDPRQAAEGLLRELVGF
jgi:negative regulator of flagellin synthesis FlgM